MRAFALAAGLCAVAAIAKPVSLARSDVDPCDDDAPPCMTYEQASTVASNFRELIVNYSNASAQAYLTTNFTDYSSSVNTLIDNGCSTPQPLDAATFVGLAAFESGQGGQPSIPFDTLNLWHTCDTVIIRWRTNTGSGPEDVTGIIVMETTYQGGDDEPFLINTVYSEFNSGAWLVDLGIFTPSCNASSKRSISDRPFFML